jgi:hypothetical protein
MNLKHLICTKTIILISISLIMSCSKKSDLLFEKKLMNKVNVLYLPENAPLSFALLKEKIIDIKCLSCHNPDFEGGAAADADFSSYQAMMNSFPAVLIKGKPLKSRFYTSLLNTAKHQMPLKAPALDPKEINYIKEFIAKCAPAEFYSEKPCGSDGDDDDDDFGDDDFDDDDDINLSEHDRNFNLNFSQNLGELNMESDQFFKKKSRGEKMKKLLIGLLLLTSVNVFAHGDEDHEKSAALKDTAEAVTTALVLFEKDNDTATVNDYKGLKATPNDHGVLVKVYTNSRGNAAYGCHRHEPAVPFECHQSN